MGEIPLGDIARNATRQGLTTDELFEMYGGGHYELWARGQSKMKPDAPGNVTKRRRFVLPGRSKPISKDPTAEEIRQAEGMRSSIAGASSEPTQAASAPPGDGLLVALLQMQAQQSQQFMALMMQMLTSSKTEANEAAKLQVQAQQQFTQMMMTLSSQQQQSMVAMMTATMQSRGGGPEEMAKYAKLLKDLGLGANKPGGEEEPGGIGRMIEDAADIVTGLAQLKGSGVIPPNGSPPAPPLPGSAASVVAAETIGK